MFGLPEGWESDYDGQRWFYVYKPTGNVQYHFPSDGDEFPSYVEDGQPAPNLAPEELLESQQQMKKHGLDGHRARRFDADTVAKDDSRNKMSATARPVSEVWNGGDAHDSFLFQPESLMFLGPETYLDVSPLGEEEDEAAKRVIAGDEIRIRQGSRPTESGQKTPIAEMNSHEQPQLQQQQQQQQQTTADGNVYEIDGSAGIQSAPRATSDHLLSPSENETIYMMYDTGMPSELPAMDAPVKQPHVADNIAELGSEEVPARAETYPKLVEIEGTEISTSTPKANTILVEQVVELDAMGEQLLARQTQSMAPSIPEIRRTAATPQLTQHTIPATQEATPSTLISGYQAYKPRPESVPSEPSIFTGSLGPIPYHRNGSLQREASLLLGARSGTPSLYDSPAGLSLTPKSFELPKEKRTSFGVQQLSENPLETDIKPSSDAHQPAEPHEGLAYVPSVLRPARNAGNGTKSPPTNSTARFEAMISSHPSILRPTRVRGPNISSLVSNTDESQRTEGPRAFSPPAKPIEDIPPRSISEPPIGGLNTLPPVQLDEPAKNQGSEVQLPIRKRLEPSPGQCADEEKEKYHLSLSSQDLVPAPLALGIQRKQNSLPAYLVKPNPPLNSRHATSSSDHPSQRGEPDAPQYFHHQPPTPRQAASERFSQQFSQSSETPSLNERQRDHHKRSDVSKEDGAQPPRSSSQFLDDDGQIPAAAISSRRMSKTLDFGGAISPPSHANYLFSHTPDPTSASQPNPPALRQTPGESLFLDKTDGTRNPTLAPISTSYHQPQNQAHAGLPNEAQKPVKNLEDSPMDQHFGYSYQSQRPASSSSSNQSNQQEGSIQKSNWTSMPLDDHRRSAAGTSQDRAQAFRPYRLSMSGPSPSPSYSSG